MSSLPLVSIITPCYNDGDFLLDCIRSVRDSIYPNIEHIIVDDGSTDARTLCILDTLIDKTSKVYHIKNSGVCHARNFGVEQSNGEYLLFLDGDDKISSEYIQLAVSTLRQNPMITVVACNYAYWGRRKGNVFLEEYSLMRLMGGNIFTVTSMLRKADFLRVGGFKENMLLGLEDWDFWLSILENGGSVHYLDGIHFFYRTKKYSRSRNNSISFETLLELRKTVYENHKCLYQSLFYPIVYSFEYLMVTKSLEYKLGVLLLRPMRKILNILYK